MSELSALNSLLKATSKVAVEKCISVTFTSRLDSSTECEEFINSVLNLESIQEASELKKALLLCIQTTLASGEIEALAELFQTKGTDVNPKLRSLVGQIISNKLEGWKEASALSRVSLPKLIDIDWSLHVKKSSSEISRLNVPVAIVGFEIEEQPTSSTTLPDTRRVDFELSKEALATMLDGLGKIRDQLSAMK